MAIPTVFISSTSEDLKPYREAARDAAIKAGFLPRMMEYFTAGGARRPLAECLKSVSGSETEAASDVLVVIVAHRYGWVPKDQAGSQGKSITWLECEEAIRSGQEALAFLVDEECDWPEELREEYRITQAIRKSAATPELLEAVQQNVARLRDFKAWLHERHIRVLFTTPSSLRAEVLAALHDWRDRHSDFRPARDVAAELAEHIQTSHGQKGAPTTRESPAWLAHFLATESEESESGLNNEFFCQQLEDGCAAVLLDGFDEVLSEQHRRLLGTVVERASQVYEKSRFVLTSRPAAYRGEAVLPSFAQVEIDALEEQAIEMFLDRWCQALFPESPAKAQRHLIELLEALRARAEIRHMARNPVMLTALAVVHWNEKRLPEQRADLYESIVSWLARARQQRSDRPSPERCVALHQELALAMQDHPAGRQVRVPIFWAAQAIASQWRELPEDQQTQQAEEFLKQEELDSGIVVSRGDYVQFWHLTLQEYLAARALAAHDTRRGRLLAGSKLYQPEWKEVVLLLAGVLHRQGMPRVDGLFSGVLDELGDSAPLADQARCFGLLGAVVQDLTAVHYRPSDPRYETISQEVLAVFEMHRSRSVDIRVAIKPSSTGSPVPSGSGTIQTGGKSSRSIQTGPSSASVGTRRLLMQRGQGTDCPRRRNGSGRHGGPRPADTPGEAITNRIPRLPTIRRTSAAPHPLVSTLAAQPRTAFWTWLATSGNGARTGLEIILRVRCAILRGRRKAMATSFAADAGSISITSVVAPTAVGTMTPLAPTSVGFGWLLCPRRPRPVRKSLDSFIACLVAWRSP